jgi:hypothetical protein
MLARAPAVSYALEIAMHGLTARLLLILSLVSVLSPVGLAASAAPQQTCCVRKCCKGKASHNHESSNLALQAPACCQQNCRCSLPVSQCAGVALRATSVASHPSSILLPEMSSLLGVKERHAAHSVRGPPTSSIA